MWALTKIHLKFHGSASWLPGKNVLRLRRAAGVLDVRKLEFEGHRKPTSAGLGLKAAKVLYIALRGSGTTDTAPFDYV